MKMNPRATPEVYLTWSIQQWAFCPLYHITVVPKDFPEILVWILNVKVHSIDALGLHCLLVQLHRAQAEIQSGCTGPELDQEPYTYSDISIYQKSSKAEIQMGQRILALIL